MGRIAAWSGLLLLVLAGRVAAGDAPTPREAQALVERFSAAVRKINEKHAQRPGDAKEGDLAGRLPTSVRKTLDRLLAMDATPARDVALAGYASAAADLDLSRDLARVEKALRAGSPETAAQVGHYVSRERFLVHARGVDHDYATQFADALEGILDAYDRTFGFAEFSKVPGKKIRVELHREDRPRPPHFAPQFPFHSTIDFPVVQGATFASPTKDGRFLFYGLCHELGHLVAMWGDRKTEEDHHAWAHYTGVVIVDACEGQRWAKRLRDQRWRSLDIEARRLASTAPGASSRDAVLKLLLELHQALGPKAIGKALNHMDAEAMGHRINHVRYYGLRDLEKALLAGRPSRKQRRLVKELFAKAGG